MARARVALLRELGVWGSRSGVRGRAPGQRVRGRSLSEAEDYFASGHSTDL